MPLFLIRIIRIFIALFSIYFATKSLHLFIEFSDVKWKRIILYISIIISTQMVMFIGDLGNLPFTLAFSVVTMLTCCKGTLCQRLAITLMFTSITFSISAICDNVNFYFLFSSTIMRLIFWCGLWFFLKHFVPKSRYHLSDQLWKLIVFLALIPLSIIVSVILLTFSMYPIGKTNAFFFSLLFISLFSFIGLLWTITVLAKQQALEQSAAMVQLNEKYYQTMEQQNFQVMRLKHDLANHMHTLSALSEEEKNKYIEQLIEESKITEKLRYCNDEVINAILTTKSILAKEYDINLSINVEILEPLPFDKPDICAIFANSLDNAIEASLKLDTDIRQITLIAKADKGIFSLNISNTFNGNFSLITVKKDSKYHGLGLKSIDAVVTKNHGHMEISREGNIFNLFLYLPLTTQ